MLHVTYQSGMSENSNPTVEKEFKTVIYKKRKGKFKNITPNCKIDTNSDLNLNFNKETSIRRILDAKLEISSTDIFDSVKASLTESLSTLKNPKICEIVSFGLGRLGECTTSRYQFALLLCLQDLYKVNISVYDPVFNDDDILLLNHFEITILKDNLEGKFKVKNNSVLFYLPHCPKQLSNNLLWVNWGLKLSYCIIIGNSFKKIVEQCSTKTLKINAEYIAKIEPYVLELPIINTFKYFEIFNDTAVHIFPKLNYLSQDFWQYNTEPEYKEDIEFIRNNVNKVVI